MRFAIQHYTLFSFFCMYILHVFDAEYIAHDVSTMLLQPANEAALLDDFKCVLCLHVLNHPIQTACSHLFCGNCLKQTASSHCPTCRSDMAPIKTVQQSNLPLARLLSQVKVLCPLYHGAGCDWTGPLDSIKYHLDYKCGSVTVPCPHCHGLSVCCFLFYITPKN